MGVGHHLGFYTYSFLPIQSYGINTFLIGTPDSDKLAWSLEFHCYQVLKRRSSFFRIHFRSEVAILNFPLPFTLESVQENTIEFAVFQFSNNCAWLI